MIPSGEAGGNASPGSARPRPRNMTGKEGNQSETGRRTRLTTGRKNGSGGMGRWWIAPLALVLAAAIIGTGVIVIAEPAQQVEEEWSAITLSFGSNPISQQLEVTFSRVAYVDQPLQWNETGFQGATVSPSGAWENNSSGYGILQFNSTASGTADASWNIASSLGPNVSYAFTDQRVALNGTGATWDLILSESQESGSIGTSGNVSNLYATAAQNAIWVQATYTSGNYTFTAYDWEEKPGGYQTVTSYPLASNVLIPALEFFEVYVYAQPLQTVVSIVNTTNGAAFGSTPAMHPVFDSNLTKLAYVTDQLGESSSTDAADIIDYTWFIDHDTYSTSPSPTTLLRTRGHRRRLDSLGCPLRPGLGHGELLEGAGQLGKLRQHARLALRLPGRRQLLLSRVRDELADQHHQHRHEVDDADQGQPARLPDHDAGPA